MSEVVPESGVSSPTRARQRIQGTNDQATYINNHSVISLLNDLLVSVVEHKPEDVLSFLVDHLTQLQTDVTRARQLLERKNRGTGSPTTAAEADATSADETINKILEGGNTVNAEEIIAATATADANSTAAANVRDAREQSMGSQRPTGLKRLIEVRVDGEVRMIPDVEDDEGDDTFHPKQAESVPSVSRALSGLTSQRGVAADEAPPSTSSATLIVQEATAVRFLLKAAERQKTPFLSMLVDHARTKAAALSADAISDLSHKSPLSLSTVVTGTTDSKLSTHHSPLHRPRRNAPTTSYLGIELLQRSSSGDQFPSLSILNNHWMVRRQIVIAVEENGDVSRTYSPVPPEALIEEGGTQAVRTSSSPPHATSSVAIAPSTTLVSQSPQRAILVQDPTPIRLLLRASERQLTPSLSILIDFARKRYGSSTASITTGTGAGGHNNNASSMTPSPKEATGAGGGAHLLSASSPPTSGTVTNSHMFGIELLHRSNAHCSGLGALGILSNHWMVRRQIVVAVKPKESPEN